jgi:hypothetical protein
MFTGLTGKKLLRGSNIPEESTPTPALERTFRNPHNTLIYIELIDSMESDAGAGEA